jgi:hypothetical protein
VTVRTRYFLIATTLILLVGVGTGLVAYYVGLPGGLFRSQDGPEELGLVPEDAGLVAFVDVQHVMASNLRHRVKELLPFAADRERQLEELTGINLERDVDRVVASVVPSAAERTSPFGALALVSGRFDEPRIEGLMRQAGGRIEEYKGARLIVTGHDSELGDRFSLAFISPGLVAVGSRTLIRGAVDLQNGAGKTFVSSQPLMAQVRSLRDRDAWAVGRLDVLTTLTGLPPTVSERLPPIQWFSAGANVDGGIRGVVQVEAANEEAANNLREVVRGFVALGRLQSHSRPAVKAFLDSLVLGGDRNTVSLTFDAPARLLDSLPFPDPAPNRNQL